MSSAQANSLKKTLSGVCPVCQKDWEVEYRGGARRKYCSDNCKNKARSKFEIEKIICTVCGKSWDWMVRGNERPKSCSEGCRKQYLAKKSREWRRSNPSSYKKHAEESRQRNRDSIQLRNRLYRSSNPDRYRNYDREKRERHWSSIRERNMKRRAVTRGAFSEHIEIPILLGMYENKCGICGGEVLVDAEKYHPLSLHIDHIVPLSKGGEHSYANAQPAHASCNLQKGDKLDGWQDIKPILNQEEQA